MRTSHGLAVAAALASFIAAQTADARGGRGGGFRGGSTSIGRGGGGMSHGGTFSRGGDYSRPHGSYSRPSGGSGAGGDRLSRPGQGGAGTMRPSQQPTRPGEGGAGTQRPSHQPSRPGQGGSGTRRDIGSGNNINNGNINTGDINIDIDHDGDWGGWRDHPIAAGIAIGAIAGMTAAAYGAAFYALPPDCAPFPYYTYTYYHCGAAWYQPQYEGDTVVYVSVPDPKSSSSPPPE